MTKKAEMEMWQIVLMILAILLLIIFLMWYGGVGDQIEQFLTRIGDLF